MLLRPAAILDDFADFHRKLRLDEHFIRGRQVKISVYVTTAFLDGSQVSSPMAECVCATLNRSRIVLISGLGVAMPHFDFF